jgi:nickel-dependent lactate racemase
MQIRLAYGRNGLELVLPDAYNVTVIEPKYLPGLPDQALAIQEALQNPIGLPPLAEFVKPSDRVGIIFSDITRPTPHPLILSAVLQALARVPRANITLFNALGTHRTNTAEELDGMLGAEIAGGYRIVQNNAFDPATQVHLGSSSFGHEIWINRELVECDVKILTGFIEPHFFAGFSGGGKAVMPGMAGLRTILGNHDAGMIGSPCSTWGITHGNPIWEEIQQAAGHLQNLFLVNVTMNREKQVTGVFAGDLLRAHAAGCAFARDTAMVPTPQPFDIVITTNSGYPLDLNLYQTVKGMSAAAQVVRQGGAIIAASECWDGVPEHGMYGCLLREAGSPQELLDKITTPGFQELDQWQAQIQALIQQKAEVYVHSARLTEEQVRSALFLPSASIENTLVALMARYGPQASICVLPEGPQTIPYILQGAAAPAKI